MDGCTCGSNPGQHLKTCALYQAEFDRFKPVVPVDSAEGQRRRATFWTPGDDDCCSCLTRDDHSFRHAMRCDVAVNTLVPEEFDRSDIRELAEIAANSDIDTALNIYRAWAARQ